MTDRSLAQRYLDGIQAAEQYSVAAEPEAQLTAPVKELFERSFVDGSRALQLIREAQLDGVRPDFVALVDGRPCGWVELKAPGKPIDGRRWRGREARQWELLAELDALLVTNGELVQLYRSGAPTGDPVELPTDVSWDQKKLGELLLLFSNSKPATISRVSELATRLAPITRLLRDRIISLLGAPGETPIRRGLRTWTAYVHNGVTENGFANDLAQVISYSLAMAALRGNADLNNDSLISLNEARFTIEQSSPVLSAALGPVLGVKGLLDEIKHEVAAVERLVSAVNPIAVASSKDPRGEPWLWFYEDFLQKYDPETRQKSGVYYTPTSVVAAQTRLVESLLVDRFDRELGFADKGVITLDPACGSGTYPLAVVDSAVERAEAERGPAGPAQIVPTLAENLVAFELMPGPYAVAHLRIGQRIADASGGLIPPAVRVYLTDTLDDPNSVPATLDLWGDAEVLAEERRRAQTVKRDEPVMVIIGNPPYGRVSQRSGAGGWIVASGSGRSLFDDILEPVNTIFSHTTSLYNLYVYFWRWALWKAFETSTEGPAVVSYITASSWLDGPGFVGLRQLAQSQCDEIWICDLGGESRGGATEENVFDIQIPVAIVTLIRNGERGQGSPAAAAFYTRIRGDRSEKFAQLDSLKPPTVDMNGWQELTISKIGQSMVPESGADSWSSLPALTDIFPWQMAGMYANRTWPISPSVATLEERWSALLKRTDADQRAEAFAAAPTGRNIHTRVRGMRPLSSLPADTAHEPIRRYSYRSFDRQWTFDDPRLINLERPALWASLSDRQVFLCTTTGAAVGPGPAATVATAVPDRHHFMGSNGGKDAIPLYRDRDCAYPNVTAGLLAAVGSLLRESDPRASNPTPEDLLAYVYGILATQSYYATFRENLSIPGLRVPISKDAQLFAEIRNHGRETLWLHTYATRFNSPSRGPKIKRDSQIAWTTSVQQIPESPQDVKYDSESQTIHIGTGSVSGVRPEVWDFAVTGWRVVQKWIGFRTRKGSGRAASSGKPLDQIRPTAWEDEWNIELLELLTVITRTVDREIQGAQLLERVLIGDVIDASELPHPTSLERKEPRT